MKIVYMVYMAVYQLSPKLTNLKQQLSYFLLTSSVDQEFEQDIMRVCLGPQVGIFESWG